SAHRSKGSRKGRALTRPAQRGRTPPAVTRLLRKLLFDHWIAINEEARAERAADGERWDWRPLVALVICAVDLTLHEYYGDRDYYVRALHRPGEELGAFAWWAGWRGIGYGLIPLCALLVQRQRLRDYGLSPRGFLQHAWI